MVRELLYWQALNRALDIEMSADESVYVLGEDVGLYGGSYPGGHFRAARTFEARDARTSIRSRLSTHSPRTDAINLGIDAPVRESGDLRDTPGIVIEGP